MATVCIDKNSNMIYNVYQGGINMRVAVSKWGNSLGIRIPSAVISSLNIHDGDSISYEVRNNEFVLKKEKSTEEMFEEFYGKAFKDITIEDLGPGSEMDWGEDIGGEVF